MATYAQGNSVRGDISPILRLYNRCKTWKTLPRAGGILEQDPLLMDLFDLAEGKVAEETKRRQDKAAAKRKR